MTKLTQMYLDRIKRNWTTSKADDELVCELYSWVADMDNKEIIAHLLQMVLSLESKVTVADNRIREKAEEIARLNKEIEAIKERVKLSAYELNQCKMKVGRPIARKGAYSEVQELELRGYTDKRIMQELGISKSTLWRYRKQAGAIRK